MDLFSWVSVLLMIVRENILILLLSAIAISFAWVRRSNSARARRERANPTRKSSLKQPPEKLVLKSPELVIRIAIHMGGGFLLMIAFAPLFNAILEPPYSLLIAIHFSFFPFSVLIWLVFPRVHMDATGLTKRRGPSIVEFLPLEQCRRVQINRQDLSYYKDDVNGISRKVGETSYEIVVFGDGAVILFPKTKSLKFVHRFLNFCDRHFITESIPASPQHKALLLGDNASSSLWIDDNLTLRPKTDSQGAPTLSQ